MSVYDIGGLGINLVLYKIAKLLDVTKWNKLCNEINYVQITNSLTQVYYLSNSFVVRYIECICECS